MIFKIFTIRVANVKFFSKPKTLCLACRNAIYPPKRAFYPRVIVKYKQGVKILLLGDLNDEINSKLK